MKKPTLLLSRRDLLTWVLAAVAYAALPKSPTEAMLPGMFGLVSTKRATITFVSNPAAQSADQTTYTFSSAALGSAVDRRVIVTIHWGSVAGVTISTVTIAGVSASVVVQEARASASAAGIVIASIPAATTTGNIVVTFSGGAARCVIGISEMIGASSATAFNTNTGSSDDPTTSTINIPSNGAAIACASAGSTGGANTAAWTGLTEDYDVVGESNRIQTGAHSNFITAETARALSVDWNVTGIVAGQSALAAASWAP